MLTAGYLKELNTVAKKNGCPIELKSAEDVCAHLYYLSKEGTKGRYIPLREKKLVEKVITGEFNSALEFGPDDIKYTNLNGTPICSATVRYVQYDKDGNKRVLGVGYHSLSLDQVFPGTFMASNERTALWSATVIGGAKSRALHEAGIGLEYFADIDEPDFSEIEKAEMEPTKKLEFTDTSESGLPIPPAPKKRGRKKVGEIEKPAVETPVEPASTPVPAKEAEEEVIEFVKPLEVTLDEELPAPETNSMSLDDAKNVVADIGNWAGEKLGTIYENAPKNIIFLARNSTVELVKKAAVLIIDSDNELKDRFAV